jgi:hypothetical protein
MGFTPAIERTQIMELLNEYTAHQLVRDKMAAARPQRHSRRPRHPRTARTLRKLADRFDGR